MDSMPVRGFAESTVGELEWSREPHETISATSLGQAAEAMDITRGRQLDELDLSRIPGLQGGRTTLANPEPDFKCPNRVTVAGSDDGNGGPQHRADQGTTESSETNPQGTDYRGQRPEDPDTVPDGTPFHFFRVEREARSTFEPQHEGSVPTDIQHLILSPASASTISLSSEGPARQNESTVAKLMGHTSEVQNAGHAMSVVREGPRVRNDNTTLDADYSPPGWLILIEVLLSVIAKAVIFNAIPMFVYSVAAIVSLSFPCLRDGILGARDWYFRMRLAPSQPANQLAATHEAATPLPDRADVNNGPRKAEPPVPTTQCYHCPASYAEASLVRCPSGHPICVDCLSIEVAQQATRESPGAVCKHNSGCGIPYAPDAILALPEAIIWQLIECAGPARRKRRFHVKREPLAVRDKAFDSSPTDSNATNPMLEVAISSGAVTVRSHGKAKTETSLDEQTIPADVKGKQRAVSPDLLSDYQDSSAEFAIGFHPESVSAFRPGTARTYNGALAAGPSNSGLSYTSVPSQDSRATTAPPPMHLLRYAGKSSSVPMSAPPTRADEDPMKEAKRLQKNAKARLKTAQAAYLKNPCLRTEAKLEKEVQACELAQLEVDRLQRLR